MKFKLWKDEDSKKDMKVAKKKFRKEQRRCVFVFEEGRNKNIENLFNKPSKEEFWKSLGEFKNTKHECQISESNSEQLKKSIYNLFQLDNEKIMGDREKVEIVKAVENYEKEARENFNNKEKQYINRETIKNIISELKNSKTRGYDGMCNNMVKIINSEIIQHKITTLINAILNTGYTPKLLNRSIIIPIIKDRNKEEFDCNNYRPISVSNVIAQILEKVILLKCKELENTSELQFGFKQQRSTLHPLFLLKEVINKHLEENMPLYIAMLDSEKAYDSVWRDGIFFKLIRKIDTQFWIILRDYYSKSDGIFKINGIMDESVVNIKRGVKQGGVLSPKLFNYFINELFIELEKTGFGCKIADKNVPIMGYCDDTMLIEKLIEKLNKLVDICGDYSKKWMLQYNIKKSVIINCGKNIYKDEEIDIKMNGIRLPVVEMSKYLGVEINKKNDDNSQIINKFRKVQKGFYGLSSFGIKPPGLQPKVKAFLYNQFM
jgi:hypothetical protein